MEPRYKRKLTDKEVEEIAENLTGVIEKILKLKWKEKTREKLGKRVDKYSDQDIQDIINTLTVISDLAIDTTSEKRKNKK